MLGSSYTHLSHSGIFVEKQREKGGERFILERGKTQEGATQNWKGGEKELCILCENLHLPGARAGVEPDFEKMLELGLKYDWLRNLAFWD